MTADATRLDSALERFLAEDWNALVHLAGSREAALAALTAPEPGMLAFMRREALGPGDPRVVEAERIRALAAKVVADLTRLGAAGEIVANGVHAGAGIRRAIPCELWAELTFDFAAGTASGAGHAYSHILLEGRAPAETVIDALAAWLATNREAHRGKPKKAIAALAEAAFGAEAYGVRDFNAAYGRVYARRRGRPKLEKRRE